MSEINLMTWNVDWFRNGRRSGRPVEYIYEDCSQDICDSIIKTVRDFLEKENAISFLQETPYKRFLPNKKMVEHELWKRFKESFPEEQYDIFMNKANALRCTVAVAKRGAYTPVEDYQPKNNRTVMAKKDGVKLLNVHMPTEGKNDREDIRVWIHQMWNELIQLAGKCNDSKEMLIVGGDFNAYVGCKVKNIEKLYRNLLKHMMDIVPPDLKTFADCTTVDHILYNTVSKDKFSYCFVHEKDEGYSDHIYVTTKFILEEENI